MSCASPLRILVVDDDKGSRMVLQMLLEEEGHEAVACESAARALEELRTSSYDVLMTDLVMPGVGGLELAHQARSANAALHVMIVSGHPRGRDVPEDIGWIKKPLRFEDLLEQLSRISSGE
jgi:CheY-like chemotaxis protein